MGFLFRECCSLYKVGPIQNETHVAHKPSVNPSPFYTSRHLCFTMWKAALLTVGVLVALVHRVQCTEDHPSFYGVKLCGREFIRAVIFTCGGSRWKRSVGDQGKSVCIRLMDEGSFLLTYTVRLYKIHPSLVESLLGEEAFDPWKTNDIPKLTHEQNPTESQAWRDQTVNVASLADGFSRSARSKMISEDVLEALRSADRKGRDVVVGLSNACCKWGCSKSEISSLC